MMQNAMPTEIEESEDTRFLVTGEGGGGGAGGARTTDDESTEDRGELLYPKNSKLLANKNDDHNFQKDDDNDEKEEQDENEMEPALSKDIYSLICIGFPKRLAFYFAIFMFLFQFSIQLMILTDLVQWWSGDNNKAGVPPGISTTVLLAQNLSLILTAMTIAISGDFTEASAMLIDGYNESILRDDSWATWTTWLMSILFQMMVGTLQPIVYFILLIQSTTVIGVMLNFAALSFVSHIDELSFEMGLNGYLGLSIAEDCKIVTDLMIPRRQRKHRTMRWVLFVGLIGGLVIPYYLLLRKQLQQTLLCSSLFVQFGDGFAFQYGLLSGTYTRQDRLKNGRLVYVDAFERVKFAYCRELEAWTLSVLDDDECNSYLQSSTTETYDLLSLRAETWTILAPETWQFHPIDFFSMSCSDCNDDPRSSGVNCRSQRGTCTDVNGQSLCVCKPDFLGKNCEFQKPCEPLELDMRTRPFPNKAVFSGSYSLLRDESGIMVTVNYRPVYVSSDWFFPDLQAGRVLIIFFGRRWAMVVDFFFYNEFDSCWPNLDFNTLEEDVRETTCPEPSADALAQFLRYQFQPLQFWELPWYTYRTYANSNATASTEYAENVLLDRYPPFFVSAPMDHGTPSDTVSPASVAWYRVARKLFFVNDGWMVDEAISSDLICALCEHDSDCSGDTNYCDNRAGIQNDTGYRCVCGEYEVGARCERHLTCLDDGVNCLTNATCLSDGTCDCVSPVNGRLCQYST